MCGLFTSRTVTCLIIFFTYIWQNEKMEKVYNKGTDIEKVNGLEDISYIQRVTVEEVKVWPRNKFYEVTQNEQDFFLKSFILFFWFNLVFCTGSTGSLIIYSK